MESIHKFEYWSHVVSGYGTFLCFWVWAVNKWLLGGSSALRPNLKWSINPCRVFLTQLMLGNKLRLPIYLIRNVIRIRITKRVHFWTLLFIGWLIVVNCDVHVPMKVIVAFDVTEIPLSDYSDMATIDFVICGYYENCSV